MKAKVSTTQKSLDMLRKRGLVATVTEYWMQFPERKNGIPTGKMVRIKKDLFGFGDVLAFNPVSDETIIVQTTTTSNQANRVAKIQGIPEAKQWLRSSLRKIEVHGWMKSKKSNRWEVTVTEIQEEDCSAGLVEPETAELF